MRKKKKNKITKYSICVLSIAEATAAAATKTTTLRKESKTRNELNITLSFAGSGTKTKCTYTWHTVCTAFKLWISLKPDQFGVFQFCHSKWTVLKSQSRTRQQRTIRMLLCTELLDLAFFFSSCDHSPFSLCLSLSVIRCVPFFEIKCISCVFFSHIERFLYSFFFSLSLSAHLCIVFMQQRS